MPTLIDLFNNLGKRTNTDVSDLTKIIEENDALKTITVPDVVYNTFDHNLLTVEQAKHNTELKKYFTRQALDGVDAKIGDLLGEYEIEPDAVSSTNSSYEKIKLLADAIRTKETAKISASSGDKKVLQEEIKKLNDQIVAERTKWKQDMERTVQTHTAEKQDMLLRSKLNSYNYSKQWDRDIALEAAVVGMNKKLNAVGGKVILDGGDLKLVNAKDPALNFTINNQEVQINDFLDKFMAESKLIQVNDPAPAAPNFQQPTTPGNPQLTREQLNAISDIDRALEEQRAGGPTGPSGNQPQVLIH